MVLIQDAGKFLHVFPECLVLEDKIFNLLLERVHGLDGLLVPPEDGYLLLEGVVLLVEEFHLVGQLANRLLIGLMSVSNREGL